MKIVSIINTSIFLLSMWISAAASGAECDNWQSSHPEWIWCDDFESMQALTTRYEDVSSLGMSQSTEDAYADQSSLKQTYTTGQVDAGWVIKVNDAGFPDHIFYRFYHKFPQGYSVFPPKMSRLGYRQRGSTWQAIFSVQTWLKSDGELTLDVLAKNSSQANGGGYLGVRNSGLTLAAYLDQWVAIEVEVKLNTPSMSDGVYRMWVDDNLVIEALNVDLRGNTNDKINEVMLDTYWNDGANAPLSRYYDNFVISTQRIGLAGSPPVVVTPPPATPSPMCFISPQTPIIQQSNS